MVERGDFSKWVASLNKNGRNESFLIENEEIPRPSSPPAIGLSPIHQNFAAQLYAADLTPAVSTVHATTTSQSIKPPSTYVGFSVFTCLCCPLIGLVAIFYSNEVYEELKKGRMTKASEASKVALVWNVIGLVAGLVIIITLVVLQVEFNIFNTKFFTQLNGIG